jgi:hypothetical protein
MIGPGFAASAFAREAATIALVCVAIGFTVGFAAGLVLL